MCSLGLRWARISVAAVGVLLLVARAEATRKVVVGPRTTLDGLARQYDVPKGEIARANGIHPEAILRDGQVLVIPDPPPLVRVPPAMKRPGIVAADRVAIRRGPGTSYYRITLVDSGAKVTVTASKDGWYQVTTASVPNGWIRADFLKLAGEQTASAQAAGSPTRTRQAVAKAAQKSDATKTASKAAVPATGPRVIVGDRVSVRSKPSTESARVTLLDDGATVYVVARAGQWRKVRLASGKTGYVREDFLGMRSRSGVRPQVETASSRRAGQSERSRVTSKNQRDHARRAASRAVSEGTPSAQKIGGGSGASAVVRTAFAFRGARYRYGGSSRGGFDCSGFTSHVFARNGINLPHSSAAQFRCGTPVPKSQLKEGDLVFFQTTRRGISHVGIYIGNGRFVHASSAKGRVRVDTLASGYYAQRYRGARRVR